jgi:hypothetical protein
MLYFIPSPELHLIVEFVECVTHPHILGSLKFLDGDRFCYIIMYQTPSDVVAEFLCDDVDRGGQFPTAPLFRENEHVICCAIGQVFRALVSLGPHRL